MCATLNQGQGVLVSISSEHSAKEVAAAISGGGGAQPTFWVGALLKNSRKCKKAGPFRADCWEWPNGKIADTALEWNPAAFHKYQSTAMAVVVQQLDSLGDWLVLDIAEKSTLLPFICDSSPGLGTTSLPETTAEYLSTIDKETSLPSDTISTEVHSTGENVPPSTELYTLTSSEPDTPTSLEPDLPSSTEFSSSSPT